MVVGIMDPDTDRTMNNLHYPPDLKEIFSRTDVSWAHGLSLRQWLFVLMGSAITFLTGATYLTQVATNRVAQQTILATQNGNTIAHNIQQQFYITLSALHTLNIIIHNNAGSGLHLDEMAQEILSHHQCVIRNLQLAPNGVVSQIYPLAGHEQAIGHDLFKDPKRQADAQRAVDSRSLTLTGPVPLVQGGSGIIARFPVYFHINENKDKFWGFVIALIDPQALLVASQLQRLEESGYHFRLVKAGDSGQEQVITSSSSFVSSQVSPLRINVVIPDGPWILEVMPLEGWYNIKNMVMEWFLVVLAGVLVGKMLYMVFRQFTLQQALEHAREIAESASRAKSDFLSAMSHEIRTPMNVVIGMGDVLLESNLGQEQQDHVMRLQAAGNSLMELINQILDFSKIEAGHLQIIEEAVQVRPLLAEARELLQVIASGKGLGIHCEVADEVPEWLVTDGVRLRQVLFNLLGNAIKFTEQGGITLRAGVTPGAPRLHVSVEDTGIGIDTEYLDRIFDPFTQADASIARRFGGSGLGLTLSRRLVERMGGHIWVESHKKAGTTFHVELPLRPTTAPISSITASPVPDRVEVCPALRILLVEDSEDNRLLVRTFLKNTPHHVEIALNGEEAVRQVESEPFDMVFMDVQMPVMDGYTATRLIRQREAETNRKPLPIIALTAHALDGEAERSQQAGCSLYLSKPIKKQRILDVINQIGNQIKML